jgi:hypothetical protein
MSRYGIGPHGSGRDEASRTPPVDGAKIATWSLEFVAHDTPERHKIARSSVTTLRAVITNLQSVRRDGD